MALLALLPVLGEIARDEIEGRKIDDKREKDGESKLGEGDLKSGVEVLW